MSASSSKSRMDFRRSPRSAYTIVAFVIGFVLWGVLYFLLHWNSYLLWLLAWSITAFGFYGFDKMQAQRGEWRVPEMVLLGLAAIGGAVGALAGMLGFRHKTKHNVFWIVVGISLVVQVVLWFWLAGR